MAISGKVYAPLSAITGKTSPAVSGVNGYVSKTIVQGDKIRQDTEANWNAKSDLISEKGVIYVYTDHSQMEDEEGNAVYVPGVKIGDGKAYLIDMPFVDAIYDDHIHNMDIHVTLADKLFWNNKVRAEVPTIDAESDGETLVLTIE